MITIHSIDLKQNDEPCFAVIGHGEKQGCRVLSILHDGCGTYRCPFFKPKGCKDWVRIDDRTGVNLIPPEDLRGGNDDKQRKIRTTVVIQQV